VEAVTSIKFSVDYSVGERVRVCLGCKVRISEEFTSTEDHEVPLALSRKCCLREASLSFMIMIHDD